MCDCDITFFSGRRDLFVLITRCTIIIRRVSRKRGQITVRRFKKLDHIKIKRFGSVLGTTVAFSGLNEELRTYKRKNTKYE
jgi:hypothetical protein